MVVDLLTENQVATVSFLYSSLTLFWACSFAVGDVGETLLLSHMFAGHMLYPQLEYQGTRGVLAHVVF